MCTPKSQRPEGIDTTQLINLLIQTDKEIQQTLKVGMYSTFKPYCDMPSFHVMNLKQVLFHTW